jgi:hypothetical protein
MVARKKKRPVKKQQCQARSMQSKSRCKRNGSYRRKMSGSKRVYQVCAKHKRNPHTLPQGGPIEFARRGYQALIQHADNPLPKATYSAMTCPCERMDS